MLGWQPPRCHLRSLRRPCPHLPLLWHPTPYPPVPPTLLRTFQLIAPRPPVCCQRICCQRMPMWLMWAPHPLVTPLLRMHQQVRSSIRSDAATSSCECSCFRKTRLSCRAKESLRRTAITAESPIEALWGIARLSVRRSMAAKAPVATPPSVSVPDSGEGGPGARALCAPGWSPKPNLNVYDFRMQRKCALLR